MPPEACSKFWRRLARAAPARAGQVPKIDERAISVRGVWYFSADRSRTGVSVSAKSGPGLGDPPAPSVSRSARPCAGGAIFRADFRVVSYFWNSFVFISRVLKRIFGVVDPGVFLPFVGMATAAKLGEAMLGAVPAIELHAPLKMCLKAYAIRPCLRLHSAKTQPEPLYAGR